MKVFGLLTLVPLLFPNVALGKAILGVDLGSLYMKVALVQRNSPLEIVTNLHSKRKTEQMVLFDQGSRFYGADANSLMGRKPHLTPQAMSLLLGRKDDHPTVEVLAERHYPMKPVFNETRSGVCLTVDGEPFTPEELVAMVLTHAKDITAAYGVESTVKDCVLTVPSFYTQHERRALLDAAELADLNVLALIDETTAAGLHYGIDRIEKDPQNVLFYNMGASALQVSVMQFHSYERKDTKYSKAKTVGSFQVLGKAWDASLGGISFDSRIVSFMADEFNDLWNKKRNDGETKDVRNYPRPMAKLRIQANKIKHVLSANNDMPIFIDSLYDDTNYQSHMDRATFEQICHDLILRSGEPIRSVLKAANVTMDEIHSVEIIGGGMRVPKVQEEIKKVLGDGLVLGMHINSDESMALGAAFHGANVSSAFKVRHVGMTDINPFPISVSLNDIVVPEETLEEDVWSKLATIFKTNGKVGVKKTIAFTHDQDVACGLGYEDHEYLPQGTGLSIEKYNVTGIAAFAKEMEEKNLSKPKVSLQFELSNSGLAKLVKAEAVVEETYTVMEEVEVDDEEEEEKKVVTEEKKEATEGEEKDEATGGESDSNETKTETKEKKKKKISVEKEKKRVYKRTLEVSSYHVGEIQPYSEEIKAESKAKLLELARKDNERMMLEETRNNYESYIYLIRNKLIDQEEEINAVTTQEQRDELSKSAEEAEDWMYDEGYDASLEVYSQRLADFKAPAEKVFHRVAEVPARKNAIALLTKRLKKLEDLMIKWETTMPQITEEERNDVRDKVESVRQWITEKEEAQEAADPASDPIFTSEEVPLQAQELIGLVGKLSKRPKPAPKKEKKNETDTKSEEEDSSAETEASEDKSEESTSEEKKETEDVKEEAEEKDADSEL